jgi:hypothetical protein
MATAAVLSAKVAVFYSGKVGRSVVIAGIIMALGHCLGVRLH